jgi:hypothetical protein
MSFALMVCGSKDKLLFSSDEPQFPDLCSGDRWELGFSLTGCEGLAFVETPRLGWGGTAGRGRGSAEGGARPDHSGAGVCVELWPEVVRLFLVTVNSS